MNIESSRNVIARASIDAGGNVVVGDGNYVINLREAAQYQVLETEILELERGLEKTKKRIETYPDDPEFREEYQTLLDKHEQKQKELSILKQEILKLAEDFSRIPINTERLRQAKQYFDSGAFREARAVLDAERMNSELDALLDQQEQLLERLSQNEKDLGDKANEFLILARLTAIEFERPDRFEATRSYFEQSLRALRSYDNVFAYALFLQEHLQYAQAEPLYQEALELCRQDASAGRQAELGTTLNNLGAMYWDLYDYERAEAAYLEALDIRRRLAAAWPQLYEADVAMTLNNLGVLYRHMKKESQSEAAHLEALAIRRQLAQLHPEQYEADLATTLNNLGNIYTSLQAHPKTEAAYREALAIRSRLAAAQPERYEADLAMTYNNLGVFYANQKAYVEAETAYRQALDIRSRLALLNPRRYEAEKAETLHNLGVLHVNHGDPTGAEAAYQQALNIRRRLALENPGRFDAELALTLNNLGVLYANQDQEDEAEAAYREAIDIRRRLAQGNPERFEPELAATLNNLGILKAAGLSAEAETAYREAVDIRRRLAQSDAVRFGADLGNSCYNLGLLLAERQEWAEAEACYREALAIRTPPATAQPTRYAVDLADTYYNLGLVCANQAHYSEAVEAYGQALKYYAQLPQELAAQRQSEQVNCLGSQSWALLFTRRFEEAEQAARQGLALDAGQEWIYTNLASALLFQGRLEEAKAIYRRFKDRHFDEEHRWAELFLSDLQALEEAGITHVDMGEARGELRR